jgi:cell division protein FtsI (penicillin-binding protein 3)/stage V sporulation protein D (sporulation-specific penicillin-binding protein)
MLQIVSADEFDAKADRQYLQSTYDYYNRGSIFFSTKDGEQVSAATLKSGFVVAINPDLVRNSEETYKAVSEIIPLDYDDFMAKAEKVDDPYEEIAKRIPADKADAINNLNLPGVTLYKERWRFYPGNAMAAQTIGFVAYKDEELAGRYGLERYYEDVLGRNNDEVYVNFFAEIFSNIQETLAGDNSLEGDVVTSIEPSVQSYLERTLAQVRETWDPQVAGGIIMDPMTGEIIALGVIPAFNLNDFREESIEIFSHDLVENVYEMGSIIKPLTMAAGLDSGSVEPHTTYYDAGSVTLNGKTFSNFDGKARGFVSMQEVLSQSLNTGVSHVVQQMGKGEFAEYMLEFGLGEETGIDLPNETHGLVENLKSPRDIEYATASFGQGIAVTPIEVVRALATLGNGGKLVNPHIATGINYRIGGSKKIVPGVEKQVLTKETSEEISRMLVKVVDDALLGGTVKMERYSIAAKTGTAQMADSNGGGYYEDRYLHSFFGYFPAFNPKFLVFLYSVDPKGARYASETLTYPFMDVAKFLINYYQIPPDR